MDVVGLVTNLISGAVGGNIAGFTLKDKSLGMIGNTIAGIVGGVAGDYIVKAVGLLNSLGLGDMTIGAIGADIGTGVISGGLLTAVLGLIKGAMSKN